MVHPEPAKVYLDKVFFEIVPQKNMEHSAVDFARCLLSLSQIKKPGLFDRLQNNIETISFEVAAIGSRIRFFAIVPSALGTYFESQILSSYPSARLARLTEDYLAKLKFNHPVVKELALSRHFYFPLRTYLKDKETDPLSSVLGALAKSPGDEINIYQINLAHGGNWQSSGRNILSVGIPEITAEGKKVFHPHPQAKLIEEKISQKGFEVGIRLFADSPDQVRSEANLHNLASSFGSFALGEGNDLSIKKDLLIVRDHLVPFFHRSLNPHKKYQYLNVDEIASLWHLPDEKTSQIKNISWGGETFNDPPLNLPVATGLTDEEKQKINFFARTEFQNQTATFGIKEGEDRRRHFYIMGKTGTGKTTLISNMAISDIKKNNGVAVIDPHGDLSEIMLNYIPAARINEVVYLDPANMERSFHLNPLEIQSYEQADIVASGIVSIFHKLYSFSWGPRLEYILRNTVMTLVKRPGSTMLDIPKLLTDDRFRKSVVEGLDDDVLRNFWQKEFDKFSENFRQEAISPILNKVGQFLSSPKIRNIVGHEKSTVDIAQIMNEEKILILNLSQGRLGEDNAALLGAFLITKIQIAAMSRALVTESERKDFYLYVDEFQNFATQSFIKILSEARKYRLNLILANQYIAQIDEDVQKAIFGNVGSLASFIVGAGDAKILFNEYSKIIPEEDLTNLAKYQIALRLSIDGTTSAPFLAQTLPLPESSNQNKDKVIRSSIERYTKPTS